MDPARKALISKEAGESKKALDPIALDVQHISRVTDFFVILGGNTEAHVQAIADFVEEQLGDNGLTITRREGYSQGRWVLLDYGDVIVHVMHRDERQYYDLERLWADAPRV